MRHCKILIFVCLLALSSAAYTQTTKSDTDHILQGMEAMDAASVRSSAIQQHFKNKNYDAAILELNKILQASPSDSEALVFRALAYFHKKQYDLALADLNKIKPNPLDRSTGRMYALKAKIYQEKGNRQSAITEAILGINADPWVEESYEVLKSVLTPQEYLAELSKVILTKERYISSHHVPYRRRAEYYVEIKNYDLAAPDIVEALKRKNDEDFAARAWSFLDFHYQSKKDAYVTALSALINGSTGLLPEALWRRAYIHYEQGKHDLAVSDLTRAINGGTQIPSLEVARLFAIRGYAYAQSGKYDLALADLNRLIASKFYKVTDVDIRAQVLCLTGKKAEAKEDEKKVIALGGKVSKPCA